MHYWFPYKGIILKMISQGDILAVHKILLQAGKLALSGQHAAQVIYKSDYTPVSNIDIEIEQRIRKFLNHHFPGDAILGEENGLSPHTSPRIWLLDPIDGTRVYLNDLPTWGISLGLLIDGVPTVGFFYMPAVEDMYWAARGFGAFLNNQPLSPLPQPDLNNRLAFLAVPTNAHRHYRIEYPRIRALGSTAVHLCYLARGAALAVLTRRIKLWDIAGVLPLLDAAGIVVTYLSGRMFEPTEIMNGQFTPEPLLAAHPAILESIRAMLQPI